MTDQQLASEILARYGQTLPDEWQGSKAVWLAWHRPYQVYSMTYAEFIDRVIEIERDKPENEKPTRFRFMRPVKHIFTSPTYAEWERAHAEWKRADAGWERAHAEWKRADAAEIEQAFAEECADAPWDRKRCELVFVK